MQLSFNEIGANEIGGCFMFYLYIDEILVSCYHNFNEIQNFIFDFYGDPVEFSHDLHADDIVELSNLIIDCLHGLIVHQYAYFDYKGHEVQIYYGFH